MTDQPYRMSISLNVLEHLGLHLYSNVPAVLSEAIANAWDADATVVDVTIDRNAGSVLIQDNGHGMTHEDINDRYLQVGYQRRSTGGGATTPVLERDVMGRKGIGKLSLFSVANTVEVYSVKDGEASALRMTVDGIQNATADGTDYFPEPIEFELELTQGTAIVLRDLRKDLAQTPASLRKRIARRFTVIGATEQFEVKVNDVPVTPEDADYHVHAQFLWAYGGPPTRLYGASVARTSEDAATAGGRSIRGWLGTARRPSDLTEGSENMNRVLVMVRGKLAHENVLPFINDGRLYSKYLCGVVHADFLDSNDEPDIAISSRQGFIENEERFQDVVQFIDAEMNRIATEWDALREREGVRAARNYPVVEEWYESLDPDSKRQAKRLLGLLNRVSSDSDEDRRVLLQHGVLAFENLRNRRVLLELEQVDEGNVEQLVSVLARLMDLEEAAYFKIVSDRLRIIEELKAKVEGNALEEVVHKILFKHLWLLDPSWERATGSEHYEKTMQKVLEDVRLTTEEAASRLDIGFRTVPGAWVIVELKKPDVVTTTAALLEQVSKYQGAIEKWASENQHANLSLRRSAS